jgi:hypothetical protein
LDEAESCLWGFGFIFKRYLTVESKGSFNISPALRDYQDEVKIIGQMLLGYGEIEFALGLAVGIACGDSEAPLHAATQVRSETSRLDIIDTFAVRAFRKTDLLASYLTAMDATRFCLKIRNQWAHCHWGNDKFGLKFQTFGDKGTFSGENSFDDWARINLATLQSQASYFEYARLCSLCLETNAGFLAHGKPPKRSMPKEMRKPHMRSQPLKQDRVRKDQEQ